MRFWRSAEFHDWLRLFLIFLITLGIPQAVELGRWGLVLGYVGCILSLASSLLSERGHDADG